MLTLLRPLPLLGGMLVAQHSRLMTGAHTRSGRDAFLCSANVASSSDDELFMSAALRQAEAAFASGEVPIGAVIVHDGLIVAQAHNRVEELRDASAHAEMLCARTAAADPRWPSWRLSSTTLYCTVEPCPMCLAALHAFRVERLVYGAPNPRLGAIEGALRPQSDFAHPYHTLNVTGGVLADQAGDLMRRFFKQQRQRPGFSVETASASGPPKPTSAASEAAAGAEPPPTAGPAAEPRRGLVLGLGQSRTVKALRRVLGSPLLRRV